MMLVSKTACGTNSGQIRLAIDQSQAKLCNCIMIFAVRLIEMRKVSGKLGLEACQSCSLARGQGKVELRNAALCSKLLRTCPHEQDVFTDLHDLPGERRRMLDSLDECNCPSPRMKQISPPISNHNGCILGNKAITIGPAS